MTDVVKFSFWIVLSATKPKNRASWERKSTPHATLSKPSVSPGQVAIQMHIDVPAALFIQPTLQLTVAIPPAESEFTMSPEISRSLAQAIQKETGLKVTIGTGGETPT